MAADLMTQIKTMLESFVEYTNDFKRDIHVSYEAKKRPYGAKVLITIETCEEKCLIIESLMKIKTFGQLKILENTLSSFKDCIEDYHLDMSPPPTDGSDSDLKMI